MKSLILIVLLLIIVVTAQIPTWISVQRSPTLQSKNSKIIGCRSVLPGQYKNIECITNWIEEQLNAKSTPEYALCQTFRIGADYELPQDADGSWGPLGSYYQSIRADTYDNAVAAMLLINANKLDEARKICDAFVLMVEFDKAADGRTRTAYSAVSPIDRDYMPDRAPTFGVNVVDTSVTTSSMAYMILALTRFYIHSQDYKYLRTAIKIGSSIDKNLRYDSEWGGFAGGFTETNGLDLPLTWRSVVHNNDVFAAARMLYGLTSDVIWQNMMTRAQNYIKHMYDTKKGFYYIGNPPISPPQDFLNTNMPIAADAQTWNALSDVDADLIRKSKSLQYVIDHLYKTETQVDDVTGNSVSYDGILYSDQGSAIQFEQTASAAMAFYHIGKKLKNSDGAASSRFINTAKTLVTSLTKNQQYAMNGDGHGIVASVNPNGAKVWAGNVFEGSSWTYYPVQHTAASAWTGLALYYIMFDDEYANPYSEYYKKPIPKFFGATITSAAGVSTGTPPRRNVDPESFAIGTAGLVVASIFAVFLVAALAIMALLNVRLVRKNYRILGGDEAATGNTVILSPIRSMNTPSTPMSPTNNSPVAVNSPANE